MFANLQLPPHSRHDHSGFLLICPPVTSHSVTCRMARRSWREQLAPIAVLMVLVCLTGAVSTRVSHRRAGRGCVFCQIQWQFLQQGIAGKLLNKNICSKIDSHPQSMLHYHRCRHSMLFFLLNIFSIQLHLETRWSQNLVRYSDRYQSFREGLGKPRKKIPVLREARKFWDWWLICSLGSFRSLIFGFCRTAFCVRILLFLYRTSLFNSLAAPSLVIRPANQRELCFCWMDGRMAQVTIVIFLLGGTSICHDSNSMSFWFISSKW